MREVEGQTADSTDEQNGVEYFIRVRCAMTASVELVNRGSTPRQNKYKKGGLEDLL